MLETWLNELMRPIAEADWWDWRGFWMEQVLDDRLVVLYCLPFMLLLVRLRGRALKAGIIATGLAFFAWLVGALFAALWLLVCIGLHRLAEIFRRESQRTDVLPIGPPLAAWAVVGGAYFASFYLGRALLPDEWNARLWNHAPWLFPFGWRGVSWEPDFRGRLPVDFDTPPLLVSIFWNPHNIGTAFLAVRMLHYFSELRRGTIPAERRGLFDFLSWLCYAPTWMQGPIERYDRFHEEMAASSSRRGLSQIPGAMGRIGFGLVKALIATLYFVPTVRDYMTSDPVYFTRPEVIDSYALLYFGIYIYIFWLYLEFSGYCDIAAGAARLLGYQQVENFDRPYLATSLRDFWRRWHISLSSLLRDYIYIPLGGNRRHVLLNICVTFGLIGIWHRPMAQLAAWGVLMGGMLWINQRWVDLARRADDSGRGALARLRSLGRRVRPLPAILAWALTMHFFCWSLLLFFGGNAIFRVTAELVRRPLAWITSSADPPRAASPGSTEEFSATTEPAAASSTASVRQAFDQGDEPQHHQSGNRRREHKDQEKARLSRHTEEPGLGDSLHLASESAAHQVRNEGSAEPNPHQHRGQFCGRQLGDHRQADRRKA